MPFIKSNFDLVSIDKSFILENIPDSNPTYIKVYLYLLALSGQDVDFKVIADKLSLLESDVLNAYKYWEEKGAFSSDIKPTYTKEEPVEVKKSDYKDGYVSQAVIESPSLKDMMQVAEDLLEKPLTAPEMDTLFWFYDGLGLSPEAVLMLLEYCVSKGKPRISYAEKVALSWCDKGLVTPEAISLYLRDSERKTEDINFILRKIGIQGRNLTAPEEEYFNKWLSSFKMSREMIVFAYEKTILATGKLSLPYMDKILTSWFENGIFTVPEAQKESENKKDTIKKAPNTQGYEYGDLEQISRN